MRTSKRLLSKLLVLISAAFLLPSAVALAQGPNGAWSPLLPPSRVNHSAIYDPIRDRMLIFGGWFDDGISSRDVWEYSLGSSSGWKRVPAGGDAPPLPYYLHCAIYDPVGDCMIVYGGTDSYGTHDVWSLSLAGVPTWTHLAPQGTPPPDRYSALTVYDAAHQRMIVFGGLHDVSSGEPFTFNDVWALSLGSNPTWSRIVPSGPRPTARCYHHQGGIYDPVQDRLIVFGGNTIQSIYLNDLWALNLSGPPVWTELSPLGGPPAPRTYHSAVYDAARSRMLVHGGSGTGGSLGDTWALSLGDPPVWTQVNAAGTQPSPRDGHASIYDPLRDRMIVFGRSESGDVDSWSLSLTGTPTWSALEPCDFPPRRSDAVTMIDENSRVLVFGGGLKSGLANDLWTLPLQAPAGWSPLAASGTPPSPRSRSAGVYDPGRDRLLIFGGYAAAPDDSVWALSFDPATEWSVFPTNGTPPSARYGHSLVHDRLRDRLLLFGGANWSDRIDRNDLWSLTLTAPALWQELAPAGTPPGPSSRHAAIYDEDRDRMIVFRSGSNVIEVWELSLSPTLEWRLLVPSGTAPTRRDAFSTVFDPLRRRALLYGGFITTEPPQPVMVPFNDIWAFDLDGDGTWSRPLVGGDPAPSIGAHGAVYDPKHDRMLVYGGRTGAYGTYRTYGTHTSATWELQLQTVLAAPRAGESHAMTVVASPNPTAREFGVSFTLPDRAPARLDVLDAAGRRIASRDVGALGPGRHVIRVGGERRIPPGVYLLRLSQGARTVSAKAAVIE